MKARAAKTIPLRRGRGHLLESVVFDFVDRLCTFDGKKRSNGGHVLLRSPSSRTRYIEWWWIVWQMFVCASLYEISMVVQLRFECFYNIENYIWNFEDFIIKKKTLVFYIYIIYLDSCDFIACSSIFFDYAHTICRKFKGISHWLYLSID